MSLDLYKLNQLIAVAQEGSITRAAGRLYVSQQALSASLRTLERETGVDLLDRSGPGVTLLPAGEALVADARVLHGLARSATLRARRIGRGEAETLRIGHTPAVTSAEITALLRPVSTSHPDLATHVNQRYPGELSADLVAGELDIGLCRAMTPEHGLARTTVGQQRLHVAVAAEHHLATRDSVSLSELAEECFVVWGQPGRSGYTDLLIGHCRQAGFEPHIERSSLQGTPPVTTVLGTNYVAFVGESPGFAAGGHVRVLELDPPTFAPLHALWPQHTSSPARDSLLAGADASLPEPDEHTAGY